MRARREQGYRQLFIHTYHFYNMCMFLFSDDCKLLTIFANFLNLDKNRNHCRGDNYFLEIYTTVVNHSVPDQPKSYTDKPERDRQRPSHPPGTACHGCPGMQAGRGGGWREGGAGNEDKERVGRGREGRKEFGSEGRGREVRGRGEKARRGMNAKVSWKTGWHTRATRKPSVNNQIRGVIRDSGDGVNNQIRVVIWETGGSQQPD